MTTPNQFDIPFKDFITPEVLDRVTPIEKEKLEQVYTAVTNLIKQYGSETVPNFGGTWQLDRGHFLNLIAYDQLDEFYIMLNEQLEDQTLSSVLIAPDRTEFSEVYIMLPDNLKLMTNIQQTLCNMAKNHNVFRDIQPPFDV